ncbi:hypothetical protein GGR52DRAFT_572723 [Hypoxylon sp. FL1284]|nr:hypothetical protein GGR52DRAFT_572723 [Hypoxylon sp. FL1284]
MVQIAQVALLFTAALSGLAEAKSCHNGGIYCGTYLLQRGDYITKMVTNLRAAKMPTDDHTIKQSLWSCIEHGDIKYLEMCHAGCIGGDKNDDYCGEDAAAEAAGEAAEDAAAGAKRGETLAWEA